MVVDAFVESRRDLSAPWERERDIRIPGQYKGPWSVPHATEIARAAWKALQPTKTWTVRVIDTAGVVVEQWPKR
jgi:hypothetical protein